MNLNNETILALGFEATVLDYTLGKHTIDTVEDDDCLNRYFYKKTRVRTVDQLNEAMAEWVVLREFMYGDDLTEFGENQEPVTYESKSDAMMSIAEHASDINEAFSLGYRDDPYEDDLRTAKVIVLKGHEFKEL